MYDRQIRHTLAQEYSGSCSSEWRTVVSKVPGKASKVNIIVIVPKPTQVDRASSPRGTGEPSLRNSAKNLDVSSRDVFPALNCAGRS